MDTKTLIIGLGGSGIRIIESLSDNLAKEDKDNCIFVGIDTDINELLCCRKKMPQLHTISLAQKMRAEDCLELDYDLFEQDHWFPISRIILRDPVYSRALTRLLLHTAIRRGTLQEFNEILSKEQPRQVILTGSLFGYTGSALILPLSLMIRHVWKDVSICGLFLLPEVMEPIMHSSTEREYARSITYAVIKELHAFTADEAGVLQKEYDIHLTLPRFGSEEFVIYRGRPLDLCILMDAAKEKSVSIPEAMEYAARCIGDLQRTSIPTMAKRLGAQGICRYARNNGSHAMTACEKPADMPRFAENGVYKQGYRYNLAEMDRHRAFGISFTPHLDRKWHDPARFPDLDES